VLPLTIVVVCVQDLLVNCVEIMKYIFTLTTYYIHLVFVLLQFKLEYTYIDNIYNVHTFLFCYEIR